MRNALLATVILLGCGEPADPGPPPKRKPSPAKVAPEPSSPTVRPADLPPARAEYVRELNRLVVEEGLDVSVKAVGDGSVLRFDSPVCRSEEGWRLIREAAEGAGAVGFVEVECAAGGRVTFERAL